MCVWVLSLCCLCCVPSFLGFVLACLVLLVLQCKVMFSILFFCFVFRVWCVVEMLLLLLVMSSTPCLLPCVAVTSMSLLMLVMLFVQFILFVLFWDVWCCHFNSTAKLSITSLSPQFTFCSLLKHYITITSISLLLLVVIYSPHTQRPYKGNTNAYKVLRNEGAKYQRNTIL